MWTLVIIGVIALVAVGCSVGPPFVCRTDFQTDDPIIAKLIKQAAEEWAKKGVLAASIVTVNEGVDGAMKFIRRPRAQLHKLCGQPNTYQGDGCTQIIDKQWTAVYIPDDLTDETRLMVVIKHELGHIFAGTKEHIPDGDPPVSAVMTLNGTSRSVTPADIEYMRQYTECLTDEEIEEQNMS